MLGISRSPPPPLPGSKSRSWRAVPSRSTRPSPAPGVHPVPLVSTQDTLSMPQRAGRLRGSSARAWRSRRASLRRVHPPFTEEKQRLPVRLFVGNLPYDVTEVELRAHFTAIGPLSSLALPTDRDTGKPRGFAFVEFRERADAEDAIRRLNNQVFKGRPLAVSEARPRDAHAPASAPRPPT